MMAIFEDEEESEEEEKYELINGRNLIVDEIDAIRHERSLFL